MSDCLLIRVHTYGIGTHVVSRLVIIDDSCPHAEIDCSVFKFTLDRLFNEVMILAVVCMLLHLYFLLLR